MEIYIHCRVFFNMLCSHLGFKMELYLIRVSIVIHQMPRYPHAHRKRFLRRFMGGHNRLFHKMFGVCIMGNKLTIQNLITLTHHAILKYFMV
jgi:hypothetical protein